MSKQTKIPLPPDQNSVSIKPNKLISILIFILGANVFLYHAFGPVAFVLVSAGLLSLAFTIFGNREIVTKHIISFTLLIGFFIVNSINLLRIANPFVTGILIVTNLFLICSVGFLLLHNIGFFRSLSEVILTPVELALQYIEKVLEIIGKLLLGGYANNVKQTQHNVLAKIPWKSLVIGLAMSIPLVAILLLLLTNGDPIFSTFISSVFTFQIPERIVGHGVFSIMLFCALLPLAFFVRKSYLKSPRNYLQTYSLVTEMILVMTLTALTLGSFLTVQWSYVFAWVPFETDLSRFGISTYSEYVRKGFTELLLASVWIYGVLWLGLTALRDSTKSLTNVLKYLQLLVIGELALFIFSIFRRVWLYQSYHGWSLLRMYGSILLVWVSLMVFTLFLRHFFRRKWIVLEGVCTAGIIIFLGVFNAESYITTHHPPTVNKQIDYIHLSQFSFDGFIGWEQSFNHAKQVLDDQSLDTIPLIDKEKRREISYAGMVITTLSRHYVDMVHNRSQEQEINNLNRSVLEHIKANTNEALSWYQLHPQLANTASSSSMVKQLAQQIIDIDKAYQEVQQGQSGDGYYYLYNNSWDNRKFTDEASLNYSFFTLNYISDSPSGPFRLRTLQPSKLKGNLDRFFTWNYSQEKAYSDFVKGITLDELLRLDSRYFQLARKIASQPENERDFEIDTSL